MAQEITITNAQRWLMSISPDGDHNVTNIQWTIISGDGSWTFIAADGTTLPPGQAFITSGTAVADTTGQVSAVNSAGVTLTDTVLCHVIQEPLPPASELALSTVGLPEAK